MEFFVPLMIGLVVGLVVLFSLLSQLKSVAQKHEASDYIKPDSLKLTERHDRFIDKHTERQMIRQAPAPGSMPGGAPSSSHQSGLNGHGAPNPQSGLTIVNAPKPQQNGGLHIVDKPNNRT